MACVGLALAEAPKSPAAKMKLTPAAEFVKKAPAPGEFTVDAHFEAVDANKKVSNVSIPVEKVEVLGPATGSHEMLLTVTGVDGDKLAGLKGVITTVTVVYRPVGTGTEVTYKITVTGAVSVKSKDAQGDKAVHFELKKAEESYTENGKTVTETWTASG